MPDTGVHEHRPGMGPHVCVQREAVEPTVSDDAPALVRQTLESPGRPLDSQTRAYMEPRFGLDFSRVRVHTDDVAAQSAGALNARAYTAGSDVVFSAGHYTPNSAAGRSLIAHELTHVVQQSEGPVAGRPIAPGMKVSDPADRFEQAAAATNRTHPKPAAADSDGAVAIQRVDEPAKTKNTPKGSKAPKKPEKEEITAPSPNKGVPATKTTAALPYEKWEKIENRISPELGINFLEIGRVATVDVKQQLYDVFKPYDADIVDRNQKWANLLGIPLAAAGNVPQDPGPSGNAPSPTYSITGGLGGMIAQVGQVAVGKILDTGSVGEAKARANLDSESLVGDVLTTDSPIFDKFEQDALGEVHAKANLDWNDLQQKFPPDIRPDLGPPYYARYVRREYGPHGSRVKSVIQQFQEKLKPYLEKLKARLEVLRKLAQRNRRLAAFTTGAVAGGIIGGAVGVGLGGSSLGGRIGGGLLGLFAGGVAGGLIGGIAGEFLAKSETPKDETRSTDERQQDRTDLKTIGPDKDDEKEEKEDEATAKKEDEGK
jgi:uncharacterized protein DUF4157